MRSEASCVGQRLLVPRLAELLREEHVDVSEAVLLAVLARGGLVLVDDREIAEATVTQLFGRDGQPARRREVAHRRRMADRVLSVLTDGGLTDKDLVAVLQSESARKRRRDLTLDGFVEQTGTRLQDGLVVAVWSLTVLGFAEARRVNQEVS